MKEEEEEEEEEETGGGKRKSNPTSHEELTEPREMETINHRARGDEPEVSKYLELLELITAGLRRIFFIANYINRDRTVNGQFLYNARALYALIYFSIIVLNVV
jgi:hypothetical protein